MKLLIAESTHVHGVKVLWQFGLPQDVPEEAPYITGYATERDLLEGPIHCPT